MVRETDDWLSAYWKKRLHVAVNAYAAGGSAANQNKAFLRAALRERDELEKRLKELDAQLVAACSVWGEAHGMRGYAPEHLRAENNLLDED